VQQYRAITIADYEYISASSPLWTAILYQLSLWLRYHRRCW